MSEKTIASWVRRKNDPLRDEEETFTSVTIDKIHASLSPSIISIAWLLKRLAFIKLMI